MKGDPNIVVVVSGGDYQVTGDPPAFVPYPVDDVPSVLGNGPALLFDLSNYQYALEPAAHPDIDKVEIPGLEEFDADLHEQWLQTVEDSLQIHAGVVATSEPLALSSDAMDQESNDSLEADAAQTVKDGASWAEVQFNDALQNMPEEAWQPIPEPATPDEPQKPDETTGDNQGSVLPL